MSKSIVVALADGFEEIEAVVSIDILRRAGLNVIGASISSELIVKGSRNISLKADVFLKDLEIIPDALLLPGGSIGAKNLMESEVVNDMLAECFNQDKIIAAICASPAFVLGKTEILDGKKATCYPAFERLFGPHVVLSKDDVVIDGNIITSRGPGTVFEFALSIVEELCGSQKSKEIRAKALIK